MDTRNRIMTEPARKSCYDRRFCCVWLRNFVQNSEFAVPRAWYATVMISFAASYAVLIPVVAIDMGSPISVVAMVLFGVNVALLLAQRLLCFRFVAGTLDAHYPHNWPFALVCIVFALNALFTFACLCVNVGKHTKTTHNIDEPWEAVTMHVALTLTAGNTLLWLAFFLFPRYKKPFYLPTATNKDSETDANYGALRRFIEDKRTHKRSLQRYVFSLAYIGLAYQVLCDVSFSLSYNDRGAYIALMSLFGCISLMSYVFFGVLIVYMAVVDYKGLMAPMTGQGSDVCKSLVFLFVAVSVVACIAKSVVFFKTFWPLSPASLSYAEAVKWYYMAATVFAMYGLVGLAALCFLVAVAVCLIRKCATCCKKVRQAAKEATQETRVELEEGYEQSVE